MPDDLIASPGINPETGQAAEPPLSIAAMAEAIYCAETALSPEEQQLRRQRIELHQKGKLGVRFGYHAEDVSSAGWGIIYPPDVPSEVQQALAGLVSHRKGREYLWSTGESAQEFRRRHGQSYGEVDPEKLPYYLMIVGPPSAIPYDFQHDLDGEHAVGRLHFARLEGGVYRPDTYNPAAFAAYADAVKLYETGATTPRKRTVGIFSPARTSDSLVQQSADHLATPLAQYVTGKQFTALANKATVTYTVDHRYGDKAQRQALVDLLIPNSDHPALVFAATHGLRLDGGHVRQFTEQGALLCQEYPGEEAWARGSIPSSMYLSGPQLPAGARFDGLVVFAFACFSAGTPAVNGFARYYPKLEAKLAPSPFIACLPQVLLAAGALAFIGHVDRAWSHSFGFRGMGFTTATFEDALGMMLTGHPIGCAMERFDRRCLDANNELAGPGGLLEQYDQYQAIEEKMVRVWTAARDARTYVVIGDPAVHLRPEIM